MASKFSNPWKFLFAIFAPFVAGAASPDVSAVVPPGGQRGSTCAIELHGERIGDAQEIMFYKPGINVASLGVTGKVVKASLNIAADCALGEFPFRLRTASGLSDVMTFHVGPFPNVDEVEPNDDFFAPQKIPMNSTVNGIVKNEDVDYFQVEAKKGQRISAEVEGLRLGAKFFDPYIAILDTNRFELAASDDTPLFKLDGFASVIAPYDGSYIVQIRETSYKGSDASRYRLHIGNFSRPQIVYPLGGKAGDDVVLRFIGDAAGDVVTTQKLPAVENEKYGVFPPNDSTPSANPFRVVNFPNVMEEDHGGDTNKPTRTDLAPPFALNGIIEKDTERDQFVFTGKKDQSYEVRVFARQLGSPLDSVITVKGSDKKNIGNNDDTKGLDSYLQFRAPTDGDYFVSIRDHLRKGGSNYVYRIEVTPTEPSLAINIPIFKKDSQDRQAVAIARGNRNAEMLSVKRENIGGELALIAAGLPEGVKMTVPPIPDGVDQVPVLFEATANAPLAATLSEWKVKPTDASKKTEGTIEQNVELVYGEPNQAVYYTTPVDRLAVAVTEEAPFSLEIEPIKVPLAQGGTLRLGVIVHRKEKFDEAVQIKLVYSPNGVNSPAEITIPKGESRGEITLQAGGDSLARKWQTAVIGSAQVGGGDLWVSTPFFDLDVATPFENGKLAMTSVEQGKVADVVCELTNFKPFDGKAHVVLSGLPPRCKADPVEFTKNDKQVTFHVTTEEKSPAGQHKGLFCNAEIPMNGSAISQTVAVDGTLRIDEPQKKPVDEPKKEVAKVEPPKEQKPVLSRLDQLREEQAKMMSGK